ncbi:MAG: helix-turn-helix domain-containing protein [Acidimicrobiia bacterium]|nr:helix-turn-helix domain-containing protein [Acidimicrobiia bacterium]
MLDVSGAADWLGVDERFIRRLVAERRVTYYKVGRHLRFDATDLDAFLEAGRVDRSPAA